MHVEVDRPIGYLHDDIVYPVNYGFVPGMMAGDGEEQDAYILGVSKPLTCFDGQVVGIIRRHNDCEDKLVVAPPGMVFHQGQIAEAVHFQERFFSVTIDSLFRKSCGVMPYRRREGRVEFLMLFQHRSQTWSFPKGHMEPGETEIQTALRELEEETGLGTVLDPGTRTIHEYPISPTVRKQVVLFPGQVHGEPELRGTEIETYIWATFEELTPYLRPEAIAACRRVADALRSE